MTEDEARTKICCGPQVIAMMIGIAAPNLAAEMTPEAGRCIAAGCMAWRHSPDLEERGPIVERRRATPGSTRPAGKDWGYAATDPNSSAKGGDWVRYESVETSRTGFCGLGGAPQ